MAVVLAVVYLPVILLSLEADAAETSGNSCSSATLELRLVSHNRLQDGGEIRIKEGCGESNETALDEVANIVRMIASNQQDIRDEIKDEIRDQIQDVKKLILPNPTQCDAEQLSKQTLVCKYFKFSCP